MSFFRFTLRAGRTAAWLLLRPIVWMGKLGESEFADSFNLFSEKFWLWDILGLNKKR